MEFYCFEKRISLRQVLRMSIKGSLGNIKNGFLMGWAYDNKMPNTPLKVDIYCNGNLTCQSEANHYRKDIHKKDLHPTGNCGFKIPISSLKIKQGEVNEIKVCFEETKKSLNNSPVILDKRPLSRRILIIGLNKSGTSILAYQLAGGLTDSKMFFEPGGRDGLNDYRKHYKVTSRNNVVCKCVFHPNHSARLKQVSALYDKKIWIFRDPRDVIISSFFYTWYKGHDQPEEKFKLAYERTVRKEANPSSMGFVDMTKGIVNLEVYIKLKLAKLLKEINKLDNSWYKIKYEDLIDKNIDSLNNYLGFPINLDIEVGQKVKRVSRSKSYGNWRNWFIESEIDYLKKIFNPSLKKLGYNIDDWTINPNPTLNPSLGSEYMLKLFKGDI